MASGYTGCACRDCFEIAVSDDEENPDLCLECEECGCDPEGESECESPHAYGADGLCEHGNWVCSVEGCENNDREES